MVQVESTKIIAVKGIGRPDYSPAVAVSKPIVDGMQIKLTVSSFTNIAGGGTESVVFYTVPDGYKLTMGSLIVTCVGSLIQRATFYTIVGGVIQVYILDNFGYDMRGDVNYGAQTAVEIPAGQDIELILYNYDNVARDFSFIMQGFLEKVGLV